MTHGVAQRFLQDPVRGQIHALGQRPGRPADRQADRHAGVAGRVEQPGPAAPSPGCGVVSGVPVRSTPSRRRSLVSPSRALARMSRKLSTSSGGGSATLRGPASAWMAITDMWCATMSCTLPGDALALPPAGHARPRVAWPARPARPGWCAGTGRWPRSAGGWRPGWRPQLVRASTTMAPSTVTAATESTNQVLHAHRRPRTGTGRRRSRPRPGRRAGDSQARADRRGYPRAGSPRMRPRPVAGKRVRSTSGAASTAAYSRSTWVLYRWWCRPFCVFSQESVAAPAG